MESQQQIKRLKSFKQLRIDNTVDKEITKRLDDEYMLFKPSIPINMFPLEEWIIFGKVIVFLKVFSKLNYERFIVEISGSSAFKTN